MAGPPTSIDDAGSQVFRDPKMKEISLTRGKVALVDDEDFERVNQYKWCADRAGYAVRGAPHPTEPRKRITVRLHRFILGFEYGDKRFVDHANLNKLDNRRANLRECTTSQNTSNQARRDNQSGYRGVSFHKPTRTWRARVKHLGRVTEKRGFQTPFEAHLAYREMAMRFQGEFARFE